MINIKQSEQVVYINLDDSGKLTKNEELCVYGGLVFLSKAEKDKFITQYRSIINDIKCKYCHKSICNNKCPEIKNTNIKPSDKRRLMNYIKKYYTVAVIIFNEKIYDYILENKPSKGRFIDYTLRRLIKEIIKYLININLIDPYKVVKIILNIDQQPTKSNGYYNLKEGIIEDLIHGICNFDYNSNYPPILYNNLIFILSYQNSTKSYVIQGADLLAGTIRKKGLMYIKKLNEINSILSFVNLKLYFPNTKKDHQS